MRRREFITLVGAAAVWPLAARAQNPAVPPTPAVPQNAAMPLVGFLHPGSASAYAELVDAFQEGLQEAGYVDGENVAIAYQWANEDPDQLPALAAELVRSQVAVIAAAGDSAAFAAKAATSAIPVVFLAGADPVQLGLVSGLARPGGNLTGIDIVASGSTAKRLELLRTLMPAATRVGVLVNPTNVVNTESTIKDAQEAARANGMQIRVLIAGTSEDIDAAFDTIMSERLDALLVDFVPFFNDRLVQLVNLAAQNKVPTIYGWRLFPEIGGLVSYGTKLADAYRQAGGYAGRILKGESPATMPVVQPTKFELVLNLKTAKSLGLDVPPALLAQADKVIE